LRPLCSDILTDLDTERKKLLFCANIIDAKTNTFFLEK
jgi:hypothetical protein